MSSIIEDLCVEIAESPTITEVNVAAGVAAQRLRAVSHWAYAFIVWRGWVSVICVLAVLRWTGVWGHH